MNSENHSARDDLAFLRALAEGGGESQRGTGMALVAGGLLYALQCFVSGAQAYGWAHLSDAFMGIFSVGITAVFLIAISWMSWKGRNAPRGGVAARALTAAFAASGTATLSMLCVFASIAIRENNLMIWLLYPCAVFALQGAAWMVAWMLRRRGWLGVVAAGWLVSAVVLAWTIGTPLYPMIAGVALVAFMAVPGAIMTRPAQN
jgi:hypothetical protein